MDVFRKDGHLSNTALEALVQGGELPPLSRLEISEHLAYCDCCLQRYTDALAGTELLAPEHSCRKALWKRIRVRTLRILTSRYATAVAAVAVALTVVWGSRDLRFLPLASAAEGPSWAEVCNSTLDDARETFDDFFDRLEEARFNDTRRNLS